LGVDKVDKKNGIVDMVGGLVWNLEVMYSKLG